MHQYKGKLILHTGSMFSGKTSSLERDLKRFLIAGYDTVAFKPDLDNRYSEQNIVTHDKTSISAVLINGVRDILNYIKKNKVDVVGIDEAQFLKGNPKEICEDIEAILNQGITVVIAGLDMDFKARPFEVVKELMPRADYLNKHHAVCTCCGSDAWVSHRKTASKKRVVLGATEEYEPLCRHCYNKALSEDSE
ncbi:MAG: thymidine kinase [Tissierellia bacterium]|nr:thymidine kinase [Tissierellia bacterium]